MSPGPRALVLGAGGMLALELKRKLTEEGFEVTGATRAECDIRDPDAIERAITAARPELLFNCAAYTAVDRAETDAEACFAINATGAENVARACADSGVTCLHVSTDYAFDGEERRPYTEDDPPSPLGVYARSKVEGEQRVLSSTARAYVVRTGELYGAGGRSFFTAILGRARSGQPVRVVDDQWVSPTWTRDLATQLVTLVKSAPPGLYHATCDGEVTWFEAARAAFELAGVQADLSPISTAEYRSPTPRPLYSVLSHAKLARLGLYRMRPWRDALAAWLAESPP